MTPTDYETLGQLMAEAQRAGRVDHAALFAAFGLSSEGFLRGASEYKRCFPAAAGNEKAGIAFGLAFALGEKAALHRAGAACSSPKARGNEVELLRLMAEGCSTDAALARCAARPSAQATTGNIVQLNSPRKAPQAATKESI